MDWIKLDPENPPTEFSLFVKVKNGEISERDAIAGFFRWGPPGVYYGMGRHDWVILPTHYAIINTPK